MSAGLNAPFDLAGLDLGEYVLVPGSFGLSTAAVTAKKDWQHTSGKYARFTYSTAATAALQNAFTVRVTDSSTAAVQHTFASAGNDAIFVALKAGYSVCVQPHGITGGGCKVVEDTTAQLVYVMYEDGVTTATQMKTAVNATCTEVRAYGGVSVTAFSAVDKIGVTALNTNATVWWTVQSATDFRIVAVLNTVTLAEVMALVNESTLALKKLSLALHTGAAGANVVTTALSTGYLDTVAAVDLVALDTSLNVGSRYAASRVGASGTATYRITFTEFYDAHILTVAKMQVKSDVACSVVVVPLNYDATTNSVIVEIRNMSTAGSLDTFVPDAQTKIHFLSLMKP